MEPKPLKSCGKVELYDLVSSPEYSCDFTSEEQASSVAANRVVRNGKAQGAKSRVQERERLALSALQFGYEAYSSD
jgi:hypothetical protein